MTRGAGHVLALDQGTSSSRAIVFDRRARPVASAQHEFRSTFPQPGWVEQDAEEIWQTPAARRPGGAGRSRPGGGRRGGHRHHQPARDDHRLGRADGQPLAPAIVWQDRRTADRCAALRAAASSAGACRTGLLLDPYFSATKMAWLLDHVPDAPGRAEGGRARLGTVDAWLVDRLTGGRTHVTDVSNASRTLLFDIHALDWHDELRLFGVPARRCREVRPHRRLRRWPPRALRRGDPDRRRRRGPAGGPLRPALPDAGRAKNTYGTGCFLLETPARWCRTAGRPAGTIAWQRPRRGSAPSDAAVAYALEGSVFVAGSAVRWLRDGLGIIGAAADVEALGRIPCPIPAASSSCRHSPVSVRRTGTPTPVAPSRA